MILFLLGQGIFLFLYTIVLKKLALLNCPLSLSMILRGLLIMAGAALMAKLKGRSCLPQRWGPQLARIALLSGGFYFNILSFYFLSASQIALLARLDVFWSPIFESRKTFSFTNLLFFSLSVFIPAVLYRQNPNLDTARGMAAVMIAAVFFTWSFILIRRHGLDEALEVTACLSGLAQVLIGTGMGIRNGFALAQPLAVSTYGWVALSGIFYLAFIYLMTLALRHYKVYQILWCHLGLTLLLAYFEPYLWPVASPRVSLTAFSLLTALALVPHLYLKWRRKTI